MIIRIYIIHMDLLWVYVYGFTIVTSLYSIVKMEGIEHLWMTLLICCSTIPAHVLCLIFAHKFRFGIVSSNDHGSLPFYVYLFVCLLYHWQEVSQISQYQMCLIRSRNCLPFIAHGFTSFFLVGTMLLIFFMFSVVLYYFLRPAFCVPNVACEYLSSVYSWLYLRFSLCLSTFELVLFVLHDITLYSTTVFQPL